MHKKISSTKAFTLIELLVVIAIIGILSSVVVVNFTSGTKEARDAGRVRELYQIGHALQMYFSDNGEYPDNSDTDTNCSLHGVEWDKGHMDLGADDFLQLLVDDNTLSIVPRETMVIQDPSASECVYRYAKVDDPCGCTGTYAILYTACETGTCPVEGRPACCTDADWFEGSAEFDPYDILIFLEQPN
ncbi:MAG: type II secretion system protein [Parcubacteria group bacterium]|nr:type II secretion system protein [Parcubacteria group bacterium]